MPGKSPLLKKESIVNLLIKVGGKEVKSNFLVRYVEVIYEVNKIPYAEIVIRDGANETVGKEFNASESEDFLPGKEVEVLVGYGTKTPSSIFKGIIVSHRVRVRTAGTNLVLRCNDKAVAMTVGRKSKYFLKSKDSDAMGKVIKENGVKAKVKATTFAHPEIIQYYCTDWDFLLKRAEANGHVVTVKDGTVTSGPPDFSKTAKVAVTYRQDIISFDAEIDARTQYPSVNCHAWDMKTQKMVKGAGADPSIDSKQGKDLTGKKLAGDIGLKKPVEFFTSAPEPDAVLKEWASAQLTMSRFSRIRGSASFQGSEDVEVGGTLEINGMGKRFNGTAYVSRVHHEITDNNWISTVNMGLPAQWSFEKPAVDGPPAAGLLPSISGLQNAVVKKIDTDPDGELRIQVDIPVIAASGDGVWARMAHFYATKEAGLFFMPEIGDEVILGFINDDPRFPVILGSLYSSKIKGAYTPDKKNNIKALVTNSKIKIEFDDEKKILIIETPGGNRVTLSDEKKGILLEDQNKNKIEMSDKGITLESDKDINLIAKGKVGVSGDLGSNIMAANGDVTLDGLNIKAKADAQVGIEGAMTEVKGSGTVKIQGGMVMIN